MANALIGCWDLGNYGKCSDWLLKKWDTLKEMEDLGYYGECSDWLLRNWDTWEEIFGILWRIF